MRHYDGEAGPALEAWKKSDGLCPSAWAKRALALWEHRNGDKESALLMYAGACLAARGEKALAIEFARLCIAEKKYELYLETIEKCTREGNNNPRVMLCKAACLIETGRLCEGEEILLSGITVPDIREGEVMTTDLWYRIKEKELEGKPGAPRGEELLSYVRSNFTPPQSIDFRMN